MRELWLMRHGAAEATSSGGDDERPLTPAGELTSRRVGLALARMGLAPDEVWHSPFRRAQQTAAAVAAQLGGCELVPQDTMTPHGHASAVCELLFAARARRLLLVSHLPLLPAVVSELLAAPLRIDLSPSSVVELLILGGTSARGSCALGGFFRADQLVALIG